MKYSIVVYDLGGPLTIIATHGPFYTKARAELWAENNMGPDARWSVVPQYNPGKFA